MPYDEELAARIRELVGDEPGLTEKKKFGGLAFLVGGNMAIAASGQGGGLDRVDPGEPDRLRGAHGGRAAGGGWRWPAPRCAAGCAWTQATCAPSLSWRSGCDWGRPTRARCRRNSRD